MKDEPESFLLSVTEACAQVAVQEKGPTLSESFLILKFQRLFLVAARKWLTVTMENMNLERKISRTHYIQITF